MFNFLASKQLSRQFNKFGVNIKMFSFRTLSFQLYINLFKLLIYTYLNKIYLICQLTRSSLFFNFFKVQSQQSYISYIPFNFYLFTLISHYFNINSDKANIVYSIKNASQAMQLFKYSFYYIYLTYFLVNLPFFSRTDVISLPKKKKLFTVLRSPHTDKKSREQFNLIQYSNIIIDYLNVYKVVSQYSNVLSLSSLFLNIKDKLVYFI